MMTPTHILLVEDNDADQYIAEYVIGKKWPACRVSIASDGEEAIELLGTLKDNLPDLILLDINMPRMNGHEFLETWFKSKELEVPVVVMLTSSEQQADKEKADAFHCVKDYLIKPLDATGLEQMNWIAGS